MRQKTALANVTLEDKYTLESGRVYLTGMQALVRLPLMQHQLDAANGLNTGGFISGYRGSPLGMYDNALWQAKRFLQENNIRFQPGLNEDLAATAVWGSQQVNLYPGAAVDGVFGIWYGKGPGVDRAADVLKHANAAGTSPNGGVLALAGDDHGGQSSTLLHQSEQIYEAAMMPVLNPATIQEYLDFGLIGFALSRFSGCWVGFIAATETAESSASVMVDPQRVALALPSDFEMPPGGLNIRRGDDRFTIERRLHGPKMAAVAAFARANAIDRTVIDSPQARFGIMTTGKAYLDVRQALADLGITGEAAKNLGIRVYKVGLTWPLEEQGARRFADGLQDVLVVEEKRSFIENQLIRAIYNIHADRRPGVVGKRDDAGASLIPSEGELTPTMVARAIVSRLHRLGIETSELNHRLAVLESFENPLGKAPATKTERPPFFCSGCPHNTSTKVPDGSRAMAGIGCHFMVQAMDRNTDSYTQMGGEGVNWIGQAPFTTEEHIFQNLGDGTYTHSGLLAIRAAAAAGVNITYKILYNDAVAMTGGQPVEGGYTVMQIARQVAAEGIVRIVLVTDDPDKYPSNAGFPRDMPIRHRDDLDAVQRELRTVKGLSVLIYDQTCAAEKRRRRKKKQFPDPPKRVFINDAVCEGCGDCSVKSNCISVTPLETEFGRKRQIDQSNCNKDYSCVDGFCPSFVTVHGGSLRKLKKADASADLFAGLPMPAIPELTETYGILVTGIGGTGVITVGALIGMAAHLEGKGFTILDFTGLAQKNGAVMSHVRLAPQPDDLASVRIAPGGAGLVLGCDMVVASNTQALACIRHGVTHAVVNTNVAPTAGFVLNPDLDFGTAGMKKTLRTAVGETGIDFIDATRYATKLMGDSIATNLFMLGYAFQQGRIPLSFEALDRAIEINGAAVEANKRAFAWGRLAAHDPQAVEAVVNPGAVEAVEPSLTDVIDRRVAFLTEYQDASYARRYLELVTRARHAEETRAKGLAGLTDAVARYFFKLMAYKDEYEVARLYTDGRFLKKLNEQFEGDFNLQFNLAPPILSKRDPQTGHLRKRAFGPWMFKAFAILARMRRLRGTALDIFGYSDERRTERRLIADYEQLMSDVLRDLTPANHAIAVELACVPEKIRGYGHVKERHLAQAKVREGVLVQTYRNPAAVVAAE